MSDERIAKVESKIRRLEHGRRALEGISMTPHAWKQIGFEMNEDGQKRTAVNMFRCGVGGPGLRVWGLVCARV